MRTKRYMGIEIRALDNQIKRLIDSKIQKSAFCRLTGSNGWIIDYIRKKSPKPVYQKDLEAEFNITRSTASKVLNLMEEKGVHCQGERTRRCQAEEAGSDAGSNRNLERDGSRQGCHRASDYKRLFRERTGAVLLVY